MERARWRPLGAGEDHAVGETKGMVSIVVEDRQISKMVKPIDRSMNWNPILMAGNDYFSRANKWPGDSVKFSDADKGLNIHSGENIRQSCRIYGGRGHADIFHPHQSSRLIATHPPHAHPMVTFFICSGEDSVRDHWVEKRTKNNG